MDSSKTTTKEENRKYGTPTYIRNASHCSAPSSSPRSSPVDALLLPDFDTANDSYGSYHHTTYCSAINNSHFDADDNNHEMCTRRSMEGGNSNIWNDVGPWQSNYTPSSNIRARTSSSTEGGGESISAKSDAGDLPESPDSKYELDEQVIEQAHSPVSYTVGSSVRQQCDRVMQAPTIPNIPPPPVLSRREHESVSDVELSTSAPLPILSPSSSLPRIARPTVFSVKPSPSRQVDVSTASKTENCIDFDAYEDLPSPMLAKLLEQLNRQRWVVPVLPDQELEVLMEIGIRLIRKGLDGKARYFDSFLEKGLVVAYDKLMHDEAMKEWKPDIHRFIWHSVLRYFVMFTEKLRQTLHPEEIHDAYWTILWQTMNCHNRFHRHNKNRPIDMLQSDVDPADLQRFTLSVDDERIHSHHGVWLLLLLNRFGRLDGFELIKAFLKENVNEETNAAQLIEWMRPVASCAQVLKPELISDVFQHTITIALDRLRKLSNSDLKCEQVKGDLRESLMIELPRVIEALVVPNPTLLPIGKEMFFFVLRYILRVLQVAPFAGRIAALEELQAILLNVTQCSIIPIGEIAEWLRKQSTIEILFRDNLHHPAFCERLERVVRVLLEKNAIIPDELDIMWDAQKEKHDAVQRNFHDLIAKLASAFNNQLQERLFARMKQSWTNSSSRERTLLLDLIRRIGIDSSENAERALTLRSLSLLWDLFRDERLCVELMDAALDAHYSIIESVTRADDVRREYIHKCIEELLTDSVFVLSTLKHMQRLMMIAPDCTFSATKNMSKNEFIETVQRDTELCSRLSTNLSIYMDKVRTYVRNLPQTCSEIDPGSLMIDGRYTHEDHLRIRLSFLHFLLSEGQLWLMTPQANELWDALVVNAVFEFERTYGFQLFASMQEQEDIDPKALDPFFETRILKLPVDLLNEEGFSCFKTFWTAVNKLAGKLVQPPSSIHFLLNSFDLEGHDYLWEIILKARDNVSRRATELWVDIFSNPHADMVSDVGQLNEFVINKCFTMLKANHDELIKGGGDDFEKIGVINRMSRILFALHCYICAFDEDCAIHERSRPPLLLACLGHCFILTVLFPVEQLQLLRKQFDTKNPSSSFDFTGSSTSSTINEEETFPVHSNMAISTVKSLVEDRIRGWEGCCVDGVMTRFQLGIQRKNSMSDEAKMFDLRERRKTLGELGIDGTTPMMVRFSLSHPTSWTARFTTSSDSSPEPSEVITSSGEDDERLLPGAAIAANPDHVRFLYTLADIGYEYGCGELRDAASRVLNQIPADALSMNILSELTESHRLVDILPSETPSRALYLLRVLHSMLLPSNAHALQSATSFQRSFFSSASCLAVFSFIDDPLLLRRWDTSACTMALWWLMCITKFVLSVAAIVKNRALCGPTERAHSETARMLGRDQQLYKEYCDRVAVDISCFGVVWSSLDHLSNLFYIEESLMDSLMRVVWAAGSRRIPLLITTPNAPADSSAEAVSASQQLVDMSTIQEDVAITSLDCLGTAAVSLEGAAVIMRKLQMWSSLVVDLLLCGTQRVRKHVVLVVSKIVCRPNAAECSLLLHTVDVLFKHAELTDDKPQIAGEYFTLLCRLLDHCRSAHGHIENVLSRIDNILGWLDAAKRHTAVHQESYPNDALLIGHFDVCGCLIAFLSSEHKEAIGSAANGKQFVRQLLDEYVLASSRAFTEMERSREGTDSHIQRSITHSAISSRAGTGSDHQIMMPRSATTLPISPNRCVPVCGTGDSVKSAYDLLTVLCDDAPKNYRLMVDILSEMFYSGPLPTMSTMNIEWEYLPAFTLRTPNSYVGLKNGGATCYMNSVFQQIFMIEPLRAAILNANCPDELDVDEGTDDRLFLFREYERIPQERYHQAMLKAVQSIFAHLLGSELQYYTPRFFWNHFRFYGQAVNVREQQDALEFYNALFDSIDEGLKKIGEAPICEKLFGGTFADQKICKDCPHRYLREEPFTSISVDIRSHNNLLDSLKEYVKGDLLNNDNAYLCEECNKKVTAIKRLCVAKLPPYLTIQLKRFDFDWERDLPQKYNDYFEFPLDLDMMPYTLAEAESTKESIHARSPQSGIDSGTGTSIETPSEKCTVESPPADSSRTDAKSAEESSTRYRLRGVIVHSGQANGGHYYSFIRSEEDSGRWYKFDDIDVMEWHLNKEEMRSTWFGGDYLSEAFDNTNNRYQKKRQKRWWNAYLLIYEKMNSSVASVLCSSTEMIASYSSTLQSHSPRSTSASVSPTTVSGLDKKFSTMSLSSRLRQLPPKLEAMIRGKNTRSMHERSQYTPQYFQLLREVTSRAVKMAEKMNETAKEEIYMLTIRLLSKFLFLTALRAKKSLRAGNLLEWQKTLEVLLKMSVKCRAWFVCNVIFQPKLIVMYLLVAPSTDVRSFFVSLLVALLDNTRSDPPESLYPYLGDCIEFKLETVCAERDTVSDVLVALLLIIPRNNFSDFSAHPTHYFELFHQYSRLGFEQKKQLVRKGALYSMLVLISKDDSRVKMIYQDTAKVYEVISSLLRTCCLDADQEGRTANPYAVASSDLVIIPPDVKQWMSDPVYVNRLLKQMLELPSDHSIAVETLLFLSWENLAFTFMALQHFSFEAMFTPAEVKHAVDIFESIIFIPDSLKAKRQRIALIGTEDHKYRGFFAQVLGQRDSNVFKPYIMLKSLVNLIRNNRDIYDVVAKERFAQESLFCLEDWLRRELTRGQSTFNYGCRSNETKTSSGLDKTQSALNLLQSCKELNEQLVAGGIDMNLLKTSTSSDQGPPRDEQAQSSSDVVHTRSHSDGGTKRHSSGGGASSQKKEFRERTGWTHRPMHIGNDGFEDKDEDNLMINSSMSVQERLAATADLPPPPHYSEISEYSLPAIPSDPRLRSAQRHMRAVSSRDISHSWRNAPLTLSQSDEDDSPLEFTSTGIEMEDAPPAYEDVPKKKP
uniref:ubiquitinyl hydrolase 1 n=1 Tax=Ascaris suum TaxID=6253 RepID=F1KPN6_ASCSU